jgi:hypothetical protein
MLGNLRLIISGTCALASPFVAAGSIPNKIVRDARDSPF